MKKYFTATILVLIVAVFSSCKKEPDAPTGGNKIEIEETTVDSVGYYAAKVSSAIISTGGYQITQHGHCWSTKSKPTTDDFNTTLGKLDAPKSYTSQLTGLEDNTAYSIRSYVTYPYGTVYGTEKNMQTVKTGKPVVNTTEVSNVTLYSAKSGGNVASNGNGMVTARGVCWNTSGNPTLENNMGVTNDGTGTGSFTSQLTGLTKDATYYVAAYATNEEGTTYGQEKSFLTNDDFTDPRDGQTYETVVIDGQTWFAENLNYETTDSWWYDNSSANGDVYGRLYTWDAALTACPGGWHLPTDEEWKTLEMYLGMSQMEADTSEWRGSDEGKNLKSTSGWNDNCNGTDAVGFTALPGGYRLTIGDFRYLGGTGYWWSATESHSDFAWARGLGCNNAKVNRTDRGKGSGLSVRCIKD